MIPHQIPIYIDSTAIKDSSLINFLPISAFWLSAEESLTFYETLQIITSHENIPSDLCVSGKI